VTLANGTEGAGGRPSDRVSPDESGNGRGGNGRVRAMRRSVRGVVGVCAFLALAEAAGRTGLVDATYLPPPSVVAGRNAGLLADAGFLADVGATVRTWLAGLVLAVLAGIPAGVLLGTLPGLDTASRALIEFLRPIPSVALIIPAVMLFGGGLRMQVTLTVYASAWPILLNTAYALRDVDPVAKDTARSFGFGRLAVLWRVSLPAAAPFIATGVRIAAAIALVVPVGTELLAGGQRGIGVFVLTATGAVNRTDMVIAGAAASGVLGYLGNLLLERAEHRFLRWHFAQAGAGR
jgi:NitT/TauT family transport system permease protein